MSKDGQAKLFPGAEADEEERERESAHTWASFGGQRQLVLDEFGRGIHLSTPVCAVMLR